MRHHAAKLALEFLPQSKPFNTPEVYNSKHVVCVLACDCPTFLPAELNLSVPCKMCATPLPSGLMEPALETYIDH